MEKIEEGIKNFAIFIISIAFIGLMFTYIKLGNQRDELKKVLEDIRESDYTIHINSQEIVDITEKDKIITEIMQVHPGIAHHSHAKGKIDVVIESQDHRVELILGRDSEYENEIYVFDPSWKYESEEIGRFMSEFIAKYFNE